MTGRRTTHEDGFTLVELLVAMTMSLIVFGLVAQSLVGYQNNAGRTTRQNDSQDQVRTAIDRIVRELRNVASFRTTPSLIETAGPHDIVFQTIATTEPAGGSANPTGIVRVRYCLPSDPAPGGAASDVLVKQTQTWNTAAVPVNPWPITSGASTACPSTPGVPAGSSISTTTLAENVMNRQAGESRSAFTFDSGALDQITTVGIDLFVDVDPNQSPDETRLQSAAFLRNQNQPPVAAFAATPTGGGRVLLNGGASSDPDGQQITFKWFRVVGAVETEIASTGFLDWNPGPGTYSIRLEVTDPGGLISTLTQEVVVT